MDGASVNDAADPVAGDAPQTNGAASAPAAVAGGEGAVVAPAGGLPAPSSGETIFQLARGWDATLTYELVNNEPVPGSGAPVFVGRKDLLDPLVNAISDPSRGGTYLISGYRGAGKTSLVVEAMRRASGSLKAAEFDLLPLVLNVSEVSASLDTPDHRGSQPLAIDPRRLLTALLRALHTSFPTSAAGTPEDKAFADQVFRTFLQAQAAQYTEKARALADVSTAVISEKKRSLEIANLLRLLGVIAVFAVLTLEGLFVLGPGTTEIQVAAGLLAGVAVISFASSRTRVAKTTEQALRDTEYVFDNSLHQVESKLKDILDQLARRRNVRTVFVLEELDKIDDSRGKQLDAVIRYFKNLFTQAPALFFFLTDKGYFDVIDEKIEVARRDRTYAVEHTFFTHRVFVSRPSFEECLAYFESVLSDPEANAAIEQIRRTNATRLRRLDEMSDAEQFLRVLLFRCQNHLFDLKNEMRGYVQVDGRESRLVFGAYSLPPQEQVLAVFQFLVEQKARLYRFAGGRDYANEILRNCLTAPFADLNSETRHVIDDILPRESELTGQLRPAERQRIAEAVTSLLEDLNRGGAIELDAAIAASGTVDRSFRWLPNALLSFRPIADLETHETALKNQLLRAARVSEQFGRRGALSGIVPGVDADALADNFKARVDEVETAGRPLPAEETLQRRGRVVQELSELLTAAHAAHLSMLVARGWSVTPMSSDQSAQSVSMQGDPTSILLLYGTDDDLQRGAQSALASMQPTGPVVVVLIEDDPDLTEKARSETLGRWRTMLAADVSVDILVTLVLLGEGLPAARVAGEWGDLTTDEFTVGRVWASQPTDAVTPSAQPAAPAPGSPVWLGPSDGTERRYVSLVEAAASWLDQPEELLAAPPTAGVSVEALVAAFFSAAKSADRPQALYDPSTSVLRVPLAPDVERRLVERGRLVVLDRGGPAAPVQSRHRRVLSGFFKPSDFETRNLRSFKLSTLRVGDDPSTLVSLAELVSGHSDAQATSLYLAAARRGDVGAMSIVVARLLGAGERQNAEEWAETLIASRDVSALQTAARRVAELNDQELSTRLFTAAAEAGDVSSMHELIASPSLDADARARWETQLQQVGGPTQLRLLANRLVPSDLERAIGLYRRAADAGDPESMLELLVRLASDDPTASQTNQQRLVASQSWELLRSAASRLRGIDPERADAIDKLLPASGAG